MAADRLAELANTLVSRILLTRQLRHLQHITYPTNPPFKTLINLAGDHAGIIGSLRSAALTQTNGEWTISQCDPAITGGVPTSSIKFVLHPVTVSVTDVSEVPSTAKIFALQLVQPYDVFHIIPNTPPQIASARQRLRLDTLRRAWWQDAVAKVEALRTEARRELDKRRSKLTEAEITAIHELIGTQRTADFNNVLQALHYLRGNWDGVFSK